MAEITPSILTNNARTFRGRIKKAKPYVKAFHIDVADGKFVKNKTLGYEFLKKAKLPKNTLIHLMTKNPEKHAGKYAELGNAVIFHIEATKKPLEAIKAVKSRGKKVGIAFGIRTPVSRIKPYLDKVDIVIPMSIEPGFSGQRFQQAALKKIKEIRALNKKVKIHADGGIKVGTAGKAAKAGAQAVASATAIFGKKDIGKAIKELKADSEKR